MRKTIVEQLAEAYESMYLKEGSKPDYLDVDKDGNKKEPMKDALKHAKCSKCKTTGKPCSCKDSHDKPMKEGLRFMDLCKSVLGEAKINKEEQYDCEMEDGSKKKLKGESLMALKKAGKVKSFKPAFKKE
jgi:hypothetical protein